MGGVLWVECAVSGVLARQSAFPGFRRTPMPQHEKTKGFRGSKYEICWIFLEFHACAIRKE